MTREYLAASHEDASDYHHYLEERYQGEVYGEALFQTMAETCPDPERAAQLRVLEQLERETKEFLLRAMSEDGLSADASPERIAEGRTLGAQLAAAPWTDLMRGFHQEIQRFVEDFERAEALAPPGREAVLQHVTAHERALLDFATRELDGRPAKESLAPVRALLCDEPKP